MSQRIRKKRIQQKTYYDKSAKTLGTLKANQTVRMQTAKGYDRIGVVKKVAKEPRSYIVESDGKEYRRNRRHLLAVPERNPIKEEPDESAPFEGYDDPVSAESTGTSTSRIYNENNVISNNTGSAGTAEQYSKLNVIVMGLY